MSVKPRARLRKVRGAERRKRVCSLQALGVVSNRLNHNRHMVTNTHLNGASDWQLWSCGPPGCQCGYWGCVCRRGLQAWRHLWHPRPRPRGWQGALARLLGVVVPAGPAAPVAVAAFQPLRAAGVLSGRSSGGGAALISGWQTGRPVPRGAGGFGAGAAAVAGPAPGVVGGVGGWAHHGAPGDALPRADGFFSGGPAFFGAPPAVVGGRAFSSRPVTSVAPVLHRSNRVVITQSPQPGASSGHWCDSGSCLRDCSATPRSA